MINTLKHGVIYAVSDYLRLDMLVIDESRQMQLAHPWITCIYDKNSEVVLGTHIGFSRPSYQSVMLALKNAIKNHSDVYVLPGILQIDNGKEFISKHLEDVCESLGIQLLYAPPRKREEKHGVERLFNVINDQLAHSIPGIAISKKNRAITLEELLEVSRNWLLDVNSKKELNGIPKILWDKYMEMVTPNKLPFTDMELEVVFGMKESRTIQRNGIVLHHLPYHSIELHKLWEEHRKKRKIEDRVDITYNPDDLSKIYVYNKFQKSYIEVPCLDQEYSKNLSLEVHRLYLKEARERQHMVDLDELNKAD